MPQTDTQRFPPKIEDNEKNYAANAPPASAASTAAANAIDADGTGCHTPEVAVGGAGVGAAVGVAVIISPSIRIPELYSNGTTAEAGEYDVNNKATGSITARTTKRTETMLLFAEEDEGRN